MNGQILRRFGVLALLVQGCFVDRARYRSAVGDAAPTDERSAERDASIDDSDRATPEPDSALDATVDSDAYDGQTNHADADAPRAPRLVAPLSTTNVSTRTARVVVDPGAREAEFTVEFSRDRSFAAAQIGASVRGRGAGPTPVTVTIGQSGSDPRGLWFFRACTAAATCSNTWTVNVLSDGARLSLAGHGVAANGLGDGAQHIAVTARLLQASTPSSLTRALFYRTPLMAPSTAPTWSFDECTSLHGLVASACAMFTGGLLVGRAPITIGDATGDGRADAALLSASGAGTIAWIRGGDSPSYGGRIDATTTAPFAGTLAAAGDINGDGLADLAVLGGPPDALRVEILLAAADGTGFSASRRVALALPDRGRLASNAALVGAGDINGDGFADLAVHGQSGVSDEVWIYFGNETPSTRALARAQISGETRQNFAASMAGGGDADADGLADLFVGFGVRGARLNVALIRGGASATATTDLMPTFNWPVGATIETAPIVATAGDLSDDGLIDCVVVDSAAGASTIDHSTRSVAGTFTLATPSIVTSGAERFNSRLLARDVTGDARAELIAATRLSSGSEESVVRVYSRASSSGALLGELRTPDATALRYGIDAF